jgi:hypothetical protein
VVGWTRTRRRGWERSVMLKGLAMVDEVAGCELLFSVESPRARLLSLVCYLFGSRDRRSSRGERLIFNSRQSEKGTCASVWYQQHISPDLNTSRERRDSRQLETRPSEVTLTLLPCRQPTVSRPSNDSSKSSPAYSSASQQPASSLVSVPQAPSGSALVNHSRRAQPSLARICRAQTRPPG